MSKAKFRELVEKWKNMDRTTEKAQKAAEGFYNNDIFPLVKEAFKKNPGNRPKKQYEGLILTVGRTPEPLILSILAIEPKKVGFLYTQDTEDVLDRIYNETGLKINQISSHEIDGSDLVAIYEAIIEQYNKWYRPSNIAVDITGGKKSMVGGATMAGTLLGADIFYVDHKDYSYELGKPEPGSEYLSPLVNPYTVFGDGEVVNAKYLYNRHDYSGAQRIFDQLVQRGRDISRVETYKACQHLCAIYEAWDNLNFSDAINELTELLKILKQFGPSSTSGLNHLNNFYERLVQQKQALECLASFDKHPQEALDIHKGFHFAFMLYHNALRREEQGKLDMACLLLYRLLEWVEQHRLASKYGINTSEPDYSIHPTLPTEYAKKRKEINNDLSKNSKLPRMDELPDKIALIEGFIILAALEDKIVSNLRWEKLCGQVRIRNEGIFAHGMKRIKKQSFDTFKSTVEELFNKAQKLAGIKVDDFHQCHKFITDPFE